MKRALSAYYVIYFMKTQCSYKSKIITFIIILTIFQNLTILPAAEKSTTHNIEHSINYFSNGNVKILLLKNIYSVRCFISRYSLFVVLRLKSDYTYNEILSDCFELLISFNLMYIIAYTFFHANNGFKSNNGQTYSCVKFIVDL